MSKFIQLPFLKIFSLRKFWTCNAINREILYNIKQKETNMSEQEETDIERVSLINDDNPDEIDDIQSDSSNQPYQTHLFILLGVSFIIVALIRFGRETSLSIAKHHLMDHLRSISNAEEIRLKFVNQRGQRPRVKFIPFPHKTLGSGEDVSCNWTTHKVDDKYNYDVIQRSALTEGVCVPNNLDLHLFSTAEAIECLSPTIQNKSIEVYVVGDSYNKHLYIGLADVLFGRPRNKELHTRAARDAEMRQYNKTYYEYKQGIPSFPHVHWICEDECYGDSAYFKYKCKNCVNRITEANNNSVVVVGSLIHVYQSVGLKYLTQHMLQFLNMSNGIIFNSQPRYQIEKIPVEFRNLADNKGLEKAYHEILPHVAPNNSSQPFIDFFQLTSSCYMKNCSHDGGHRARFVNRWKAQLLLNTICEVEY